MGSFKCDNCGDLDYALVDGYAFGDRLLEGVMFEIRVDGKGEFEAKCAPPYMDYEDLNKEKWLKDAAEYAKQSDVLTCPECKGDIDVPGPAVQSFKVVKTTDLAKG